MFLLSKIFTQLTSPLTLCLLLVPLGLLLLRLGWRRSGRCLIGFGLTWLLLWSLPGPSFWLCANLEHQHAQHDAAEYPISPAIVVLGGGIQPAQPGWRAEPNLASAADRVWFAARLYHAGRAPRVLLSGGTPQGPEGIASEARSMALFITDLGVPNDALLLEVDSRNTRENARYSARLLRQQGIGQILLVTSALHMQRAAALFRAEGLHVIEAATDFEAAPPTGPWPMRWLPDAQALDASSRALKEYLGILADRLQKAAG